MENHLEQRLAVIDFIIRTMSSSDIQGRYVRREYLRDKTREKFPDMFDDYRKFSLYFNSIIDSLVKELGFLAIENTAVRLTEEGHKITSLKDGIYGYQKTQKRAQREGLLTTRSTIAANILRSILAVSSLYCVVKGAIDGSLEKASFIILVTGTILIFLSSIPISKIVSWICRHILKQS